MSWSEKRAMRSSSLMDVFSDTAKVQSGGDGVVIKGRGISVIGCRFENIGLGKKGLRLPIMLKMRITHKSLVMACLMITTFSTAMVVLGLAR